MHIKAHESLPVNGSDKFDSDKDVTGRRVEVGPDNLEWVALEDIHLLKQVRQEYDQRDIEALAYSIVRDNDALHAAVKPEEISQALQLMHSLTLNRLQPEDAHRYLMEHASFYDLQQPEIIPEIDRPIIVNIAGHRRFLALEFIAVKMKGIALSDVHVLAQVYDDLPFAEALALQLRENVKTNPPPQDEAKSIDRYHQYIKEMTGVAPTVVDIASRIGFKVGKVRDALAFRELPESIQDYAGLARNSSAIPYSTLVDFKPLQDALRARYEYHHGAMPTYSEQERDRDVTNELHIMANKILELRLKRASATYIKQVLKNKIRLVQGETLVATETLFDVQGDDSTTRRQESSARLATQAIRILKLLADQDQLSEKHRRELEALKAVH